MPRIYGPEGGREATQEEVELWNRTYGYANYEPNRTDANILGGAGGGSGAISEVSIPQGDVSDSLLQQAIAEMNQRRVQAEFEIRIQRARDRWERRPEQVTVTSTGGTASYGRYIRAEPIQWRAIDPIFRIDDSWWDSTPCEHEFITKKGMYSDVRICKKCKHIDRKKV
jgi:hypothetical protein